jgi:hypothetical protein
MAGERPVPRWGWGVIFASLLGLLSQGISLGECAHGNVEPSESVHISGSEVSLPRGTEAIFVCDRTKHSDLLCRTPNCSALLRAESLHRDDYPERHASPKKAAYSSSLDSGAALADCLVVEQSRLRSSDGDIAGGDVAYVNHLDHDRLYVAIIAERRNADIGTLGYFKRLARLFYLATTNYYEAEREGAQQSIEPKRQRTQAAPWRYWPPAGQGLGWLLLSGVVGCSVRAAFLIGNARRFGAGIGLLALAFVLAHLGLRLILFGGLDTLV